MMLPDEQNTGREAEPVDSLPEDDGSYFPVPLATMQPETNAPVDLYVNMGPPMDYVLYKAAGTPLRDEMRERLLEHGVEILYLRGSDREIYYNYVEQHLRAILSDDMLPNHIAAELLYESSSRVMEEVFNNPRTSKNLQRANDVVQVTVTSLLRNPDSIWRMTEMAAQDAYTYSHCVQVGMFLVAASRNVLGITDPQMLTRVGLGGILHDIGKSMVRQDILNKPGKLTTTEFQEVKKHPDFGEHIVRQHGNLMPAVAHIVLHHHEHYDGTGYPEGLMGKELAEVVRLSTLVDVYNALTTDRPYADAKPPYAALRTMVEMDGHFDSQLLRSFIQFLGPNPMRRDMRARWHRARRQRHIRKAG